MITATARLTDPETSHEAAASVGEISKTQFLVLLTIAQGPQTDEEIVSTFSVQVQNYKWVPATPQSIRSRRSELVKLGLVSFLGEYGITSTGRRTRVWKITEAGIKHLSKVSK